MDSGSESGFKETTFQFDLSGSNNNCSAYEQTSKVGEGNDQVSNEDEPFGASQSSVSPSATQNTQKNISLSQQETQMWDDDDDQEEDHTEVDIADNQQPQRFTSTSQMETQMYDGLYDEEEVSALDKTHIEDDNSHGRPTSTAANNTVGVTTYSVEDGSDSDSDESQDLIEAAPITSVLHDNALTYAAYDVYAIDTAANTMRDDVHSDTATEDGDSQGAEPAIHVTKYPPPLICKIKHSNFLICVTSRMQMGPPWWTRRRTRMF